MAYKNNKKSKDSKKSKPYSDDDNTKSDVKGNFNNKDKDKDPDTNKGDRTKSTNNRGKSQEIDDSTVVRLLNPSVTRSANIKIGEIFKSGYNKGLIYSTDLRRISLGRVASARSSKFGGITQRELIKPTDGNLGQRIGLISSNKYYYTGGQIAGTIDVMTLSLFAQGNVQAFNKILRDLLSNVYNDVPLFSIKVKSNGSEGLDDPLTKALSALRVAAGLSEEQLSFILLVDHYKSFVHNMARAVRTIHKLRMHIPALKLKWPHRNEQLDDLESQLSRSAFTTQFYALVKYVNNNFMDSKDYVRFCEKYETITSKTPGSDSPVIQTRLLIRSIADQLRDIAGGTFDVIDGGNPDITYPTMEDALNSRMEDRLYIDIAAVLTNVLKNDMNANRTLLNDLITQIRDVIKNGDEWFYAISSFLATYSQTEVNMHWKQDNFQYLIDKRDNPGQFNRKIYFEQTDKMSRIADIEDELRTTSLIQLKSDDALAPGFTVTQAQGEIINNGTYQKLTPILDDIGINVNDITEGSVYSNISIGNSITDQNIMDIIPGKYKEYLVRAVRMDGYNVNAWEDNLSAGGTHSIPAPLIEMNEHFLAITLKVNNTDGVVSTWINMYIKSAHIVSWERVTLSEYTDGCYADGFNSAPMLVTTDRMTKS